MRNDEIIHLLNQSVQPSDISSEESSTKADEYSKDEPSGYYDGVRALLLCRVCMGEFYYTADRETNLGGRSEGIKV